MRYVPPCGCRYKVMSQDVHEELVGLSAGCWWLVKLTTAATPAAVADRLVRVISESLVD